MCASSSESLELNMDELFTETQVSKLEPPPKFLTYKIPGDAVTEFANETLSLRVVGSHSLWVCFSQQGHHFH